MSAFIVSNQCIEGIVNHLSRLDRTGMAHSTIDPLKALGYDIDDEKDMHRLAEDMHALNEAAVEDRYEGRYGDTKRGKRFNFEARSVESAQVYKALSCLLYQCAEGDVPEKPLYKALETIRIRIAEDIVRDLPCYDDFPWG